MVKWINSNIAVAFAIGLLLGPTIVHAQGYDATRYFEDLFIKTIPEFSFKAKSKAELVQWQDVLRSKLKSALGLALNEEQNRHFIITAKKEQEEDSGDFILEKWTIWTEPDVPLPIVVLIPKNIKGKTPLVLTLHGHGKNSIYYDGIYPRVTDTSTNAEVRMSATSVKQGYLTIAPTVRGFGNTRTKEDIKDSLSFSCRTQLKRDLLVGRTPIGDRVWDIQQILTWALKQFPVDEKCIGITGHSGGGTIALFAAAIDQRIKVAAISSYFNTFKGSIGSLNHCECNYIPGILRLAEMSDVAGLMSPRHACFVHGKLDPIYPIEETRKAFQQLQKIYTVAQASNNLMLYEGEGGHQFYEEATWHFIKSYFNSVKK